MKYGGSILKRTYGDPYGSCQRKVRYESWADAEAICLCVMDEDRRRDFRKNLLLAYACDHCGGWHTGHVPTVTFAPVDDPVRSQVARPLWTSGTVHPALRGRRVESTRRQGVLTPSS